MVHSSLIRLLLNCTRKLKTLSNLTRLESTVAVNGFTHVCKLNMVTMDTIDLLASMAQTAIVKRSSLM